MNNIAPFLNKKEGGRREYNEEITTFEEPFVNVDMLVFLYISDLLDLRIRENKGAERESHMTKAIMLNVKIIAFDDPFVKQMIFSKGNSESPWRKRLRTMTFLCL